MSLIFNECEGDESLGILRTSRSYDFLDSVDTVRPNESIHLDITAFQEDWKHFSKFDNDVNKFVQYRIKKITDCVLNKMNKNSKHKRSLSETSIKNSFIPPDSHTYANHSNINTCEEKEFTVNEICNTTLNRRISLSCSYLDSIHALEEIQMESSALFISDDEMDELPDFIPVQLQTQSTTIDKSILIEHKKTLDKIKRRSCGINDFCDETNPSRTFEKNDGDSNPLSRTYELNNSNDNPLSRTYEMVKDNNLLIRTENDNSNNIPLSTTYDSNDSKENPLMRTFEKGDKSVNNNPDESKSLLPGTPSLNASKRLSVSLQNLGSLNNCSVPKPKMVPLGLKKESLISQNIKLRPRVPTLNKKEGVIKKNGPLKASRLHQNMIQPTQAKILKECAPAPITRRKGITHSSELGDSFEGAAPTGFSTPLKEDSTSRLPNGGKVLLQSVPINFSDKTKENSNTTSVQQELKQKATSKLSFLKSRISKHSERKGK